MSEAIGNYQARLNDLQVAEAEAKRLARTVISAGKLLENWQTTMVSNSDAGFPMEVTTHATRKGSIDANDWPTAKQLASTLANWHNARFEVQKAYAAIPENVRGVIAKPPTVSI